MEHSFDIEIASKYSIEEAILLKHFHFWIKKNEVTNTHYYEGRYWTYGTQKELAKLYPYFSEQQVKRIIQKLVDNGLIEKGNYNRKFFDQTTWYALTELAYSLLERRPIVVKETVIEEAPKEKVSFVEVIEYLNEKVGRKFSHKSNANRKMIQARLNEGFTIDDFKKVIDNKTTEWLGTQFEQYLRPETLFGTKFDRYLNEVPTKQQPTKLTQEIRHEFIKERYETPTRVGVYNEVYLRAKFDFGELNQAEFDYLMSIRPTK